jgi:hypothetical protein
MQKTTFFIKDSEAYFQAEKVESFERFLKEIGIIILKLEFKSSKKNQSYKLQF